jgi:predicted small lipoprotein YifL
MKKVLFTMLVIAALALASCGNKKAPAAEPTAVDSTAVATEMVDTVKVQ